MQTRLLMSDDWGKPERLIHEEGLRGFDIDDSTLHANVDSRPGGPVDRLLISWLCGALTRGYRSEMIFASS